MDQQYIDILTRAIPNLMGVYLFGSRKSGQTTSESDWDIAILLDGLPMDAIERWKIQEELADHLRANVDLVDLGAASTVFRFEVIAKGERVFCGDRYFCDSFEMTAISMYQRFQEERKELLKAIIKRGSVYG